MIVFPCYPKKVTIVFYEVLNDVKNVIAYSDPAIAEYNKPPEKDAKKDENYRFAEWKKCENGEFVVEFKRYA